MAGADGTMSVTVSVDGVIISVLVTEAVLMIWVMPGAKGSSTVTWKVTVIDSPGSKP